jgi:hypothetical protein
MGGAEEIIKLAARVLFQEMASPYRAAFERRIGGVLACGLLAFIAGLAGVGCGIAALWLWLAPLLGPAAAAAISMGVLLAAALILGLVAARFARRSPATALTDLLDSKEISGALDRHLPELLIAAAVGGLLFGLRRKK